MTTQLTETELEWLYDYLESDQHQDTTLDFYGLHGVATACAILLPVPPDNLAELIFDDSKGLQPADTDQTLNLACKLITDIKAQLDESETPELPEEIQSGELSDELEAWCGGFMQLVFEHEDQLSRIADENLSTLMFPIEIGSGFFDDEPEFRSLAQKPLLRSGMLKEIPENLLDLYLLFQGQ